jgi:hypothetical protein
MAKKRTELEARLLEEHGRVISVVQRWQSEQQAVLEGAVTLAGVTAVRRSRCEGDRVPRGPSWKPGCSKSTGV